MKLPAAWFGLHQDSGAECRDGIAWGRFFAPHFALKFAENRNKKGGTGYLPAGNRLPD